MVSTSEAARVAAQIGSSLLPDNAQWINRFTVQSHTSNATYVVAQRRSDGVWGCGCKGWTHYRRCKHTADILRRLAAFAERVDPPTFRQPEFVGDTRGGFRQPADKAAPAFNPDTLAMLRSARVAFLDLETKPVKVERTRGKRRVLQLD